MIGWPWTHFCLRAEFFMALNHVALHALHALHLAHHSALGPMRTTVRRCGIDETVERIGLRGVRPARAWRELVQYQHAEQLWLLTHEQAEYPELLAASPDAPLLLYGRGDPAVLSAAPMVSLVGSRNCTRYGMAVVNEVVPQLVRAGFVTVSGLAYGIDAAVHRATLAAGGRTIAVLGGSVTDAEITPRAHVGLAHEILAAGGAVIAEYPPGTVPYASLYPERNRIVVGLSLATMVVEAAERSGSLISARLATEAGRSVLAVPGPIFAHTSSGTNQLIAGGAAPFLSCQSLFDELECELLALASDSAAHVVTQPTDSTTAAVLRACRQPRTLDQIITDTGLSPAVVLPVIAPLCLTGELRLTTDHRYRAAPLS